MSSPLPQQFPATICLRPAVAPGRVGVALSLVCLFAMIGGALTTRLLQGNLTPQASSSVEPPYPGLQEARLRCVATYIHRWNAKTDPDGIAHIRSEELCSCYNLMTGKVLPLRGNPPAREPVPPLPSLASP